MLRSRSARTPLAASRAMRRCSSSASSCLRPRAPQVRVRVRRTLAPFRHALNYDFCPADVPAGAGAAAAGGAGVKRARSVAFDVPPPGVVITVRDLEAKHRSVSIAVPDEWDALLQRLRDMCGYGDSHRLYYSSVGLLATKKKLASAADFAEYADSLGAAGRLPDIWVLRAPADAVPSPEQLPTAEAVAVGGAGGGGAGDGGGAASSSGRSSAQQTAFRDALLRRDATDSENGLCALCGTDSDVQAAHILPQKRSDQFTRSGGLHDAMATAGLANLYDTCNGFLLCDQCHDFFDAYLWSVDSEQVVVMSNALTANVPSLAAFSGKQLFPDNTAASLVARMNRPLPGVWVWHFQAFKSATAARHANAALKLFDCSRCKKRYVQEWRKDKHEATCTAVRVPAKHYFTPATKQGSAASGGGGAGAGGGGGGEK